MFEFTPTNFPLRRVRCLWKKMHSFSHQGARGAVKRCLGNWAEQIFPRKLLSPFHPLSREKCSLCCVCAECASHILIFRSIRFVAINISSITERPARAISYSPNARIIDADKGVFFLHREWVRISEWVCVCFGSQKRSCLFSRIFRPGGSTRHVERERNLRGCVKSLPSTSFFHSPQLHPPKRGNKRIKSNSFSFCVRHPKSIIRYSASLWDGLYTGRSCNF